MAKRRTWIWALVAFGLFVGLFAVATTAINRLVLGQGPAIGGATVLDLQLAGPIGERPRRLWGNAAIGPLTVREIDEALRRGARDDRVVGAVLRVGPLTTGFGKAQELRSAIEAFARAGKPTIATLELGSILDLYVATAAETVVQVPTGTMIVGLVSRRQYYRELLDKIGVELEAFHTGPYKTGLSPYTDTQMQEEERRAINSLLDSVYGQLVGDVADSRGLSTDAVRSAIDRGLLSAGEAQSIGLIDQLGFADTVEDLLPAGSRRVGPREYLRATTRTSLLRGQEIALVHVDGLIVPGEVGDDPFGGGLSGGDTIARYLRRAREDRNVVAVVLRVDSPGGAVTASDVIRREAELLAAEKPVIVSMSDVAASGGYWLATAGTKILADRGTYTGSIGVFTGRINLQDTYEMLGINNEVIKRGANADILLDSRPLTEEQREILQASIEETYRAFIELVADARDLPPDRVETLSAGRVWTGEQALEQGLIDDIGGLRVAIEEARRAAGLPAGRTPALRVYPETPTVFEQLRQLFMMTTAGPPPDVAGVTLDGGLADSLAGAREVLRALVFAGRLWSVLDAPLPVPAR